MPKETMRQLLVERDSLKQQVADLEMVLHKRDAVITLLENEAVDLRDKIHALSEVKTLLEQGLRNRNEQVADLEDEIEWLKLEKQNKHDTLVIAEYELSTAREQLSAVHRENGLLRDTLDNLKWGVP